MAAPHEPRTASPPTIEAPAAQQPDPAQRPLDRPVRVDAATLTFGEVAENHVGMQQVAEAGHAVRADIGFDVADLERFQAEWEQQGASCELVRLNDALDGVPDAAAASEAAVLVARGGADALLGLGGATALMAEQVKLPFDKKAWMRGRVVNKHARWNLCFAEDAQPPDYADRKGRVVAYGDVPVTDRLRKQIGTLGPKASGLACEGNYYYDVSVCGIGFHGDSERRKVVAVRLGKPFPLHYQWFLEGTPVGKRTALMLGHGDMYIMSEKAAGTDWKRRKIFTLRHAAGAKKFTQIKAAKARLRTKPRV
eukprot:CAMPEP_0182918254 /NCGR_PEP_ID=MMETSP0105_2-20130417/1981_1 /TAXON_ID=81532 ORGANISM="Acanthoeca-like sp., Strain 10tr" /NCGR_SAMPLE_ID=MMETSP0105_2 /ASSEMBLY_ACC=CAM_ASM_000205 /LENGTH=308 /DNA_ID=CAMNT_0025055319 /DNA_START=109 /DNA_END=1035 /DNA_ORIENTATION=+